MARILYARLVDGRPIYKLLAGLGRGAHKAGYGTARKDDGPSAVTGGRRAHTGRREPGASAPVAAAPEALVVSGGWQIDGLPATVRRA